MIISLEGLDGESNTTCSNSSPYIVPSNKRLIILSTDQNVKINGITLSTFPKGEVLILNSGDVLSPWNNISDLDFNGILIDPFKYHLSNCNLFIF